MATLYETLEALCAERGGDLRADHDVPDGAVLRRDQRSVTAQLVPDVQHGGGPVPIVPRQTAQLAGAEAGLQHQDQGLGVVGGLGGLDKGRDRRAVYDVHGGLLRARQGHGGRDILPDQLRPHGG